MKLEDYLKRQLSLEGFDCCIRANSEDLEIVCNSMEDCDRLIQPTVLDPMLKEAHELGVKDISIDCGRESVHHLPVQALLNYDKSVPLFDYFFYKLVGSIKEPQKVSIQIKEGVVVVLLVPDEECMAEMIWRYQFGGFLFAGYYLEVWVGDRQYASSKFWKGRRIQH